MSIFSKYEVLEPVEDLEIRSFVAQEIASGRRVVIHFMLRGYTQENNRLLRQILYLPSERRHSVIEVGEHDGVPFVVTEDLMVSLNEWLNGGATIPPAAPQLPAVMETASETSGNRMPGEFTMMFKRPVVRPATPAPEPKQEKEPGEYTPMHEPPARPATPAAEGPEGKKPGEFTAAFGAPPARPATPAAEGPEGEKPGEFTAAFGAPPARPATPAAEGPEGKKPGEFTAAFGAPAGRLAIPAPEPQPQRPQEPGQFTTLFQPPVAPPSATSAAISAPLPVGQEAMPRPPDKPNPLSVIDSWQPVQGSSASGKPRSEAPLPPSSPLPAGPSEYTRIIKTGPPKPRPTVPVDVKPAPAEPQRSNVPLIVILVSLLVIAVGLVLFFALRAGS
jgi:hypothetical protein